ncbi:tetratricopeptide repeat protein [bacterium]|nr:tetratricopeptide repeat protein [bacterium]
MPNSKKAIEQAAGPVIFDRVTIWISLTLLVIIAGLYAQTRGFEFLNFDDKAYILDNEAIRSGLTFQSFKWALTAERESNWHPLTWWSHALDIDLFGLEAGYHHLINVLLHGLNTVILFLFLFKATGARRRSAFVALLFAVHPLNVESVAWVAERKNLLCFFFGSLTLLSYTYYYRQPRLQSYVTVCLLYLAGLMAKPMLVSLPFLLLLLDYWPFQRLRPDRGDVFKQWCQLIIEKLPLFVLSLGSCVVTLWVQNRGGAVKSLLNYPFPQRLANALLAYLTYLWKTVLPVRLSIFYPYPHEIPIVKAVGAGLILLVICVLVFVSRIKRPYLVTGWLWFLGSLVPVIGLVQVGQQSLADRYAYFAHIGPFIIISWSVSELGHRWRIIGKFLVPTGVVFAVCLFFLSWNYLITWKSSLAVFEHALTVTEDNCVAHNNLGTALAEQRQWTDAHRHYQQAIAICPHIAEYHNNLGLALFQLNQLEAAQLAFQEALELKPDYAEAYDNAGITYFYQAQLDLALDHFREAIKCDPTFVKAMNNLGFVLVRKGRIHEACQQFARAHSIEPSYRKAADNLHTYCGPYLEK